jgi:hypothetical protein
VARARAPAWIFDELPPSGARRGDDPAQHAFRPDLATFVREVIQNANDQAIGPPRVGFRARVLAGAELRALRDAIDWDTLAAHLRATGDTRSGKRMISTLAELERARRLPVLFVEDRNTVGLTGAEDDPRSHFRALCKDTLFSHKREASAGGSYGLGKSVLWAFSGIRTVVFASRLQEDPRGHVSPRLIGRAELPSHELEGRGYVGSGWFGVRKTMTDGRARAESVWGDEASSLCATLGLVRGEATGTSILVLGVRDPTDDDDALLGAPHRLLSRIGGHAAAEFWPAMLRSTDPLVVEVDGRVVDPRADPLAAPFCACMRGPGDYVEVPRDDGDVAVRTIAVEIPRRRDERHAVAAEIDLVVRLAEAADRPGTGTIAAFRGPGMVVRRWDGSRLASALRPFHAILRCGLARGDSEADLALERFLRAAEPPGHDDWIATAAIKDDYVRGAQAALTQLHDKVMRELRGMLAPTSSAGVKGPERLRRRLAVTPKSARASEPGPVGFGALSASLQQGRWCFEGEIRPRRRTERWTTQLAVRQVGEDGSLGDDVEIATLELASGAAVSTIEQGRARIEAALGDTVRFTGTTIVLRGAGAWLGEIALELVAASIGGGGDR